VKKAFELRCGKEFSLSKTRLDWPWGPISEIPGLIPGDKVDEAWL